MNNILVDSDALVYSAGWAGSKRYYLMRGMEYQTKAEALLHGPEDELLKVIEPEPLSHVIHNLRVQCQHIIDALSPIGYCKFYLTGKDNFRDKIATIKPYKGNRPKDSKPVFYEELRQYLVDEWQAEVIDGMEADDKIAMEFTKDKKTQIVCGVDKDFLQIEDLRFYNIQKRELFCVDALKAKKNFWKQMLTGDVVDNISGVEGIGPKKAEKIIDPLKEEISMYNGGLSEYNKTYGKKGFEYLIENGK